MVGIGRTATRQLGAYLEGDKEYQAQLVLGKITDSYDLTGKVVETRDFVFPSESQIREALDCFRGEIMQTPPPFSAVKVGGVRLYRAARKGVILEAKPRKVRIEVIELTGLTNDGFVIQVVCSHGTYIRSLAHQIGLTLGCGAHLTRLVRTRVGAFTLDRAEPLEQFISRLDFERTTT